VTRGVTQECTRSIKRNCNLFVIIGPNVRKISITKSFEKVTIDFFVIEGRILDNIVSFEMVEMPRRGVELASEKCRLFLKAKNHL